MLHRHATLGLLTRQWLESPVGKFVLEQAQNYERDILLDLAEVDPTQTAEIRRLQERAKVPSLLLDFLNEAIELGEESTRILEQMKED